MRAISAALALSLVATPLWACLNDEETERRERRMIEVAIGEPQVFDIIVGRFDRNPPLYYEMRLEDAKRRIGADAGDLAAYDNAAVACDRNGRYDEAIAWMERKKAAMDRIEAKGGKVDPEHRYRYFANVGTHRMHRWVKAGADRSRLVEVKTARDLIAQAVAIKPDAHFGREKYQLRAMEWVLNPPAVPKSGPFPSFIDGGWGTPKEAVEALCGLIVLGNAWESVDVFHALALALEQYGDDGTLSYMARLRCNELIDAGRTSLLPGAPSGRELQARMAIHHPGRLDTEHARAAVARFQGERVAVDESRRSRIAAMTAMLEAGQHPDHDPAFWADLEKGAAIGLRNEDRPHSRVVREWKPVEFLPTLGPELRQAVVIGAMLGLILLSGVTRAVLRGRRGRRLRGEARWRSDLKGREIGTRDLA